jgi:hypothetical protein
MNKMHESLNTLVSSLMGNKSKSFREYVAEAGAMITPPSGQTIAPTGSSGSGSNSTAAPGGSNVKSIWPGNGAPVEVGMTVGLKGPNGMPVPGQVSQVDMGAKGVKVKNPTTGQDEWANIDTLQPFMAQGGQQGTQPNQPAQQQTTQTTTEDADLIRLKELAGIRENCSAGATGAGAIAIAPAAMGKVKRRQETDEAMLKKEYTPKESAKTIIGDTKPNQASGQLSANLAATGIKTASRSNNGRKRK